MYFWITVLLTIALALGWAGRRDRARRKQRELDTRENFNNDAEMSNTMHDNPINSNLPPDSMGSSVSGPVG